MPVNLYHIHWWPCSELPLTTPEIPGGICMDLLFGFKFGFNVLKIKHLKHKLMAQCKRHNSFIVNWKISFEISLKFVSSYNVQLVSTGFNKSLTLTRWEAIIWTDDSFYTYITGPQGVNTLWPSQNGCHFTDDTFKRIFLNENDRISIKISLKFVPKAPITQYSIVGSDNGLAPARRQAIIWTNSGLVTDPYMRRSASMS